MLRPRQPIFNHWFLKDVTLPGSTSDASTQTANFQPLVSQRCDTSTQTYTPLQVSLKVPQSLHAVPLYDLSHAFASKCASYAIDVRNDFLPLCLQAITNLKENERSNLLYNLAKGLGTKKKDTNETIFPLLGHSNEIHSFPLHVRL